MEADWRSIVALRAAYFASRGEPVQERPEATWRVYERDGRIVGAYSYQDHHGLRQRWILDFYATPDSAGKTACLEMWRDIVSEQREHGYAVAGTIAADNTAQLDATTKRGFRAIGVIVLREAQECPQQ